MFVTHVSFPALFEYISWRFFANQSTLVIGSTSYTASYGGAAPVPYPGDVLARTIIVCDERNRTRLDSHMQSIPANFSRKKVTSIQKVGCNADFVGGYSETSCYVCTIRVIILLHQCGCSRLR